MGFDPVMFTKLLDEYSANIYHIHYWGESDEPWYHAVYQLIKHRNCKIIENINTPVAPYIGDAIDRYVYVSDYVKEAFGQEDGKSSTVHPGSDFKLFNRDKFEDVIDDCIGMVYRLENDKLNLDSIKPFIEVVKKRSQTKVIIVGGGSNQEAYQNICKEEGVLDAFTFTGYVDYETLPEWYRQFSIFVAPVWKESFGQVASFAMSMGLPVVGYDIGAISEIIGKPEFLAEPGNSEQLADIIIDLLNDRSRRLETGRHNQKRVHSKFSLEAMTSSYQEIYDQLLKEMR
jgi:glycosyltransferase involved in cell wall biosynthesis